MRFLDTSRIRTRFDERVTSRDGTELSVDLYLPPEQGRYAVLLNRTAADNNRSGRLGMSMPPAERCKAFAAQGYIVAAADVRGRGDSAGDFIPFVHEGADGADTVAWLRTLEECSGRVGVWGSGYGAFCAWAAAVADGHVDAIASISPFGAVGTGLVHRGGALRLEWLFWMHLVGGRTVQPANVPRWTHIHRHLPLATMNEAVSRNDIEWGTWLRHLDPQDEFWAALDLAEKIAALNTPGLHVTGHWDTQACAARHYYEAACQSGAPQQWIAGPWDTAAVRRPVPAVGGFDFGPRSVIDLDETLTEFFDTCLRSEIHSAVAKSLVFVTGRNEWERRENSSVHSEANSQQILELHLGSTLGANTRRGDGTLCTSAPTKLVTDVVTHNPAVPVEFQPQFVSFAAGSQGFTLDQAHITARDEALVYTSAPLDSPVTVLGRPRASLTVRTVAADADLFVLLSDSFPMDSRDLHLGHAALRVATSRCFVPGELVTVTLELDAIAHVFLAGHRIRLTVTPSLFPLYARNLHGKDYIEGCEIAIADIELHHGPATVSSLILPLAKDRD